jgi:hypothetical protein
MFGDTLRTMKRSLLILAALLEPVATNAGDWFLGFHGWGIYSPQPGKWFLQLRGLADIPITVWNSAVGLFAILVICTLLCYVPKSKRIAMAEPDAAPNGGPATPSDNSKAAGGPPSVS